MTSTTPLADGFVTDEPLAVRDTLPIAKRSRAASRVTMGLLVALGLSAGFLVGVLIDKDQGASSSSAGAPDFAALAQQFGGALPGAGGAGAGPTGAGPTGAGAGGGTTTGQIKLVDGANVYVVDAQGTTTKVATNSDSKISTAQPSSLVALKVGDTVTVVGATGSDGTVTATSITAEGASTPAATP